MNSAMSCLGYALWLPPSIVRLLFNSVPFMFLPNFGSQPELKNILTTNQVSYTVRRTSKPKNGDENFRYTGSIPAERKRSARLAKVTPQYTYEDLPEENLKAEISVLEDVIDTIYKPRRSKSRNVPVPCMAPEDVTDSFLSKIAFKGFIKTYSDSGTSCHQCRQKTLDSKTFCRSGHCTGVRGQFCGTCLLNRYGEDARVVLKDPNWACPPCRGICNCSICRNRDGKRPTGILAPIAQASGHRSVKDFLISLKGEGDYVEEKPKIVRQEKLFKTKKVECKVEGDTLLGFDEDLSELWAGNECDTEIIGFDDGLPLYRIPDYTVYTDFYENLDYNV